MTIVFYQKNNRKSILHPFRACSHKQKINIIFTNSYAYCEPH
nr:MAG TPA: hypothetical protein [Caudoviricetes sp.]